MFFPQINEVRTFVSIMNFNTKMIECNLSTEWESSGQHYQVAICLVQTTITFQSLSTLFQPHKIASMVVFGCSPLCVFMYNGLLLKYFWHHFRILGSDTSLAPLIFSPSFFACSLARSLFIYLTIFNILFILFFMDCS